MQNHKDDFDGDRAGSLVDHSEVRTDPREKWLAAGANDDLAFLMAMLALAEGAGQEEPTDCRAPLLRKETFRGRAEDASGGRQSSSRET
jgi:hypothetical protein